MRKIFNTILVIGSLLFASCENYDEDERLIPVIGETDLTTPITKQQSEQAILVEDFTGWNCPNCPGGTEVLETEMAKYQGRLIVSAIHTGSFARPSHENNNLDFRTPYGDELKQTFNVTSYPAILINRQATAISSIGDWSAKIAEKMANIIAVKSGNEELEKIAVLKEALKQPNIGQYIEAAFGSSVIYML